MRVPSIRGSDARLKPLRSGRGGMAAWFRQMWTGEAPLGRVFWQDMLIGGTLINVTAMLAAFLAIAAGAPGPLSLAILFAPLPYNLLLLVAVWRAAARAGADWVWPARIGALLWFALALLL